MSCDLCFVPAVHWTPDQEVWVEGNWRFFTPTSTQLAIKCLKFIFHLQSKKDISLWAINETKLHKTCFFLVLQSNEGERELEIESL